MRSRSSEDVAVSINSRLIRDGSSSAPRPPTFVSSRLASFFFQKNIPPRSRRAESPGRFASADAEFAGASSSRRNAHAPMLKLRSPQCSSEMAVFAS